MQLVKKKKKRFSIQIEDKVAKNGSVGRDIGVGHIF